MNDISDISLKTGMSKDKMFLFSSPWHIMLKVSYCDRSVIGIHHCPSVNIRYLFLNHWANFKQSSK